MRRLTYTDPNGISYVLNDDITARLRWNGLRGFGILRPETLGQRVPYQDGVEALGLYTGPREMRVALDISAATHAARLAYERAMRRNLSPYKDRSRLGVLTIEDVSNSISRAIACWLTECPDPEETGPFESAILLSFWAPQVFFYDPVPMVEAVAISGGGLSYPITYPAVYGATGIDSHIYTDNPGDIEAWPMVRIQATGGTDPKIENKTTGRKFELDGVTLGVGDYVDIDMAEATVVMYDADAGTTASIIEKLSEESEFFPLVCGGNDIHVRLGLATSGSVTLTYYARYLAI
jgi:hypothetical protein